METLPYVRANDRLAEGATSPGTTDRADALGTWYNTDAETGEIRQFIISEDEAGALQVQAFGACEPELCDWGVVPATAHASSLTAETMTGFEAHYDFGFMETHLAANIKRGTLVIQSYNTFKDDSGRASYFTREFFHQHIEHAAPARPGDAALPFMLAADLPEEGPPGPVDLSAYLGTWINTHRRTDAIQSFTVRRDGDGYVLHAVGAGAPRAWGSVPVKACADGPGSATARGFLAHYDFGFSDVFLACNDNHGLLIIASYHTFNDDSGRSNYFRREFFYRAGD